MFDCEVCGKRSDIHLTKIVAGSLSEREEHHYCYDHAPPELNVRRPTVSEELKATEDAMAKLDATEMDADEKAAIRKLIQQHADDIAAGRRPDDAE